jgi:hypothetical protein
MPLSNLSVSNAIGVSGASFDAQLNQFFNANPARAGAALLLAGNFLFRSQCELIEQQLLLAFRPSCWVRGEKLKAKNRQSRLPCRTMAALLKKFKGTDQRVLTPAW